MVINNPVFLLLTVISCAPKHVDWIGDKFNDLFAQQNTTAAVIAKQDLFYRFDSS
jgi:hypothetical protein